MYVQNIISVLLFEIYIFSGRCKIIDWGGDIIYFSLCACTVHLFYNLIYTRWGQFGNRVDESAIWEIHVI